MVKIITKIFLSLLLLIVFTTSTPAQEKVNSASSQIDTSKFVMKKSPWGAVLRSALVPGFGQFYNESYWKIPVVWGFMGYFIYTWNTTNNSYVQYRDLFSQSITKDNPNGNSSYLRAREFYKDQRDLFAVYLGLTYFLNLVDAYVDAQLFDFNVKENQFGQTVQLSMKIKF
ncbi:MAG: DUF5683 domain-containing protein [Bacteroidetes bacterium]|nr:DUF5683 domain-containing protein [Bacteroidota bacterium]